MGDAIKVGGVVVLKSGSPLMTTTFVDPNDERGPRVFTTWFVDGKVQKGDFPLAGVQHPEA